MAETFFSTPVQPDWQALVSCIMREGTPERVHHIELFLDWEVQEETARRFGLLEGLDADATDFGYRRQIAIQRFLGYDYVRCGLEGMDMSFNRASVEDTAALKKEGGRNFMNEHRGPITTWEEFEAYPWPDPARATTNALEWFSENLPDDMCIIGSGGFAHFAEHMVWVMGYETLCYSLYDQRDLVEAIARKLIETNLCVVERLVEFDRVKLLWGSDDMGFRTGLLIGLEDTREFFLRGHKLMAQKAHEAGRPYLLHSCGNMSEIMEDLIEDVRIDARHSFEDVIEPIEEAVESYGDRIALLGGLDVDFLCRAGEERIRARVRSLLEQAMPGGGYCLGSGNSVTNYTPVDNYLAMVDEGRNFRVTG